MVMEAKSHIRKSKLFAVRFILLVLPLAVLSILLTTIMDADGQNTAAIYIIIVVVLVASYQAMSSVIPLLTTVLILEDHLVLKGFFGKQIRYDYAEIEGYKKQVQPTRFQGHPVILVYAKGKKVGEISSHFTTNVLEIEQALKTRIPYLGNEPYHYFKNIWNKMLWR